MSREDFMIQLKDKLRTADVKAVKRDVEPFIKDHKGLEIWSNDYFVQLADMVKFV